MTITIAREQLKGMNFRDVATGRLLAPMHPGEVLVKDFIEAMGITRYKVAKLAGVQQLRIPDQRDRCFRANVTGRVRVGRLRPPAQDHVTQPPVPRAGAAYRA